MISYLGSETPITTGKWPLGMLDFICKAPPGFKERENKRTIQMKINMNLY